MKKTRDSLKILLASLGFCLLAVILSGCSDVQQNLWLNARGWGRAKYITSTSINDPAYIAIDDQGYFYVLVVDRRDDLYYPRVVKLDRELDVLWERSFDIAVDAIDQPRIVWGGAKLQVFWISRNTLYYSQADSTGEYLDAPIAISNEYLVDGYDVEFDPELGLMVWFAGNEEEPGLYAMPPGDLGGEPELVDPLGLSPDIQHNDGTLHAMWWHDTVAGGDNRIFYGAYPDGDFRPEQETLVYDVYLQASDGFEGPYLGIDGSNAYVLWTLSVRTGLRAGTIEANYLHFPLDDPTQVSSRQVIVAPVEYHLGYQSMEGTDLEVGERVSLENIGLRGTSVISNIATQPVAGQELAIAVRIRVSYLMNKMENQIGMIYFSQGAPSSYQLLSFTASNSTTPTIINDADGFLYVSWLEKVGDRGRAVYFTSTSPDVREAISPLAWDDIRALGLEISFGMLMGLLMIPFAMVWIIAPIIVLGLTSILRREDEKLTRRGSMVSIILALLAYWMSKIIILPTMWDYVPFSTWIPFIPEALKDPLRYLVPFIIAVIGVVVAWNYTYRRERNSVLFFTLLYAAVDAALTMAIYGVILLAAV